MKNKLMMSGLMALVLGLGVSSNVFAYQGDFSQKGPNCNQESREEMTKVMKEGDYESWKNLIEKKVQHGRVDKVINESNFSKFREAWMLAQEGKIKEANIIRRELGLRTSDGERPLDGQRRGSGKGQNQGQRLGLHR